MVTLAWFPRKKSAKVEEPVGSELSRNASVKTSVTTFLEMELAAPLSDLVHDLKFQFVVWKAKFFRTVAQEVGGE